MQQDQFSFPARSFLVDALVYLILDNKLIRRLETGCYSNHELIYDNPNDKQCLSNIKIQVYTHRWIVSTKIIIHFYLKIFSNILIEFYIFSKCYPVDFHIHMIKKSRYLHNTTNVNMINHVIHLYPISIRNQIANIVRGY